MSLQLYREESKKIFEIINRYSKCVEKAGCDEAFLDVGDQVEFRYKYDKNIDYAENQGTEKYWEGAYFMSFKKSESGVAEGAFVPESILDKKLFLANQISKNLRNAIYKELGYRASAGISHNKSCAKIASSQNKPDHQTVVPVRYMKKALSNIEITKMRFCGGKISNSLAQSGITKMGQIQDLTVEALTKYLAGDE